MDKNMLTIKPIPAFNDNYIWLLINESNQHAIIVDPGDAKPVFAAIEQFKVNLTSIFVTHHHYDHSGGVATLVKQFAPQVYGPANETIPAISQALKENDKIQPNGFDLQFTILDIPAHTAGHIAFYSPGMVFCGDTLFTGGCGRLFEGTAKQMHDSLQKLAALPDDTMIYCGHEYTQANLEFAKHVEPDNADLLARIDITQKKRQQNLATVPESLAMEKKTNPFLRCHIQTVHKAAEKHCGKKLHNSVEVLQVIRDWKNHF